MSSVLFSQHIRKHIAPVSGLMIGTPWSSSFWLQATPAPKYLGSDVTSTFIPQTLASCDLWTLIFFYKALRLVLSLLLSVRFAFAYALRGYCPLTSSGKQGIIPASILRKSTSGRHRPVSYPDGPMTARYRFTYNADWVYSANETWDGYTGVITSVGYLIGLSFLQIHRNDQYGE